jgi:uncharacterized protein (TIGR00290 family)
MRGVASWSGGKDSCLAYYKAILEGMEILYLLNLISTDAKRSVSHQVDPELIVNQAVSIEVPVAQKRVTWDAYERAFKEAVSELKTNGVEAIVTGDIDLAEGKEWNDKMGSELGIKFISPLWENEPEQILNDFVGAGFEAVVGCVRAETLAERWIGRKVDSDFIDELCHGNDSKIHPWGEMGEYHTLVIDGPIFRKRIEILASKPVYQYLEKDIGSLILPDTK